MQSRSRFLFRDGCGYLAVTVVFTCIMLVLNSKLVLDFYGRFAAERGTFWSRDGVRQLVLFTGPLLLVVIEWYVFDQVVRLLRRWSSNKDV